ncbi:hypothetical protein SAMN05216575_101126 [Ectopseudomonas alcaliphila]|uniref:Uncharacterized protein n=1 Tax=Ectopseudomonas alcaliphila TaxID=101564 RepID=A0A1G6T2G6_9GAMM|nr:hypothetical protein SAMN05216575_101126 [Pseudomonas alcaliphila]
MFALQQPYSLFMGFAFSVLYFFFLGGAKTFSLVSLLLLSLSVVIVSLPSVFLHHGLSPLFYVCSTLFVAGAAFSFSRLSIARSLKSLHIVFWFFWGVTLCLWGVHRNSAEPLGEIISGSSTNGIPSYFIVLQVAVSLAFLLCHSRLPILTPIATLVVAFLGLGRGSIVVALALLMASLAFNFLFFYGRSILVRGALCSLLSLVSVISLIVGFYVLGDFLSAYIERSKFSSGLMDPYRALILSEYLDRLDFLGVLFGGSYEGTVIDLKYDGNPHVAFIRTHAFYGLPGLLLVLFSPFILFFARRPLRFRVVGFSFLCLLLVRALTEPILFPTLLDFFYLYIFFIFFKVHAVAKR